MLFGIADTVAQIAEFRVAAVVGKPGSGKTMLSFALAMALYDTTYYKYRYIVSNCPAVLTDNPNLIQAREYDFLDTIFILDEFGLFAKTSKQTEQFLAYPRKFNVSYILPSTVPPPSSVRAVLVRRVFTFQSLGLPLQVWKTQISGYNGNTDSTFYWWRPAEFYGLYDTRAPASDADDLVDLLADHNYLFQMRNNGALSEKRYKRKFKNAYVNPEQKKQGSRSRRPAYAGAAGGGEYSQQLEAAELMSSAAGELSQKMEQQAMNLRKKRKVW